MRPHPSMSLASYPGAPSATLVSASLAAAGTTVAVSFPGAVAGDIAFISVPYTSPGTAISGGAGSWTRDDLPWTTYGYVQTIFRKVLAAGDLGGVNVTAANGGGAIVSAIYRGATVATLKASNPDQTDSSLALSGFTKSGSCKGIVTIAVDRDPETNPTPPAGFMGRVGPGVGPYFTNNIADLLVPAAYTNGASVVWTDFAIGAAQVGLLYELT